MRATKEATERFVDEADLAEVGYATLGRTGLKVSRLGFGTFRMDDRVPPNKEALVSALSQGVNLIDTAAVYNDGHAETAVGQALAEVFASGKIKRDQVVVVDKVGLVQGETLRFVREKEAEGGTIPGMVHFQDALWYCIHPDWIEAELDRSLERLKLDSIDLLLIHNPETFLAEAANLRRGVPLDRVREQLRERLRLAFEKLEQLAAAGKIGWYGLASSAVIAPKEDPQHVSIDEMVGMARDAARKSGSPEAHHFAAVELPLNLIENRSATAEDAPVAKAKNHNLAVLVDRPLNAVLGPNRVVRLAEPPAPPPNAPKLADAAAEVQAIEGVFAQDWAPKIRVQGGPPADQMFRWGTELADAPQKLSGLDHWMAMQAQVIAPQVQGLLQQLSQGFKNDMGFQTWGKRYVDAMNGLLTAVTADLVRRLGAEAAQLKGRIEPIAPDRWRGASLSRQALATLLSTDGVTAVFVGMRRKPYVDDALGAVALPPLDADAVRNVYEAFSK